MIKRVKLETIYKMAKEDNEEIKIVNFSRTDGMKKSTIIITNCRKIHTTLKCSWDFWVVKIHR